MRGDLFSFKIFNVQGNSKQPVTAPHTFTSIVIYMDIEPEMIILYFCILCQFVSGG